MKILFKFILLLLIVLLPVLIATSCSSSDDLDAIFYGKTWYIHGVTINGKKVVSEIKEIYETPGTYQINFTPSTFTGILTSGSTISGTWSADGKKQSIMLHFDKQDGVNQTELSSNIFQILKSATSYSGDVNVLKISKDKNNFIELSSNSGRD